MLVVIKEVLPSEKWVAEPKLLQMMHNRGLVTAQRRDFGVFFRKHAGLLDRMMSGTGTEEKGFACIFVNISANEGSARVRHYYKLPSSTSPLRYEMPAADQATREATLRRQRNLPEKLVREYTAEYGALPEVEKVVASASSSSFSKVARRRTQSPRYSETSAGSTSKFGDSQVFPCPRSQSDRSTINCDTTFPLKQCPEVRPPRR